MSGQVPNQLDRLLAERGDAQFGVVSRAELLSLVPADDIDWAIKKLRLRPLWRGVYAVGHTAIRREGWWLAALKACGEGSALGGRSAGQFWRYCNGPLFPISVYSRADRGRTQPRIATRNALLGPGRSSNGAGSA